MSCRTGPCCLVSYRRMGERMSCRTGPCYLVSYNKRKARMSYRTGPCCLVSYKRKEEKDVMPDRSSVFISYKRMEEKDVVPDRSLLINLSKGQFGLRTRSLCFMMIAAKQRSCRSTVYSSVTYQSVMEQLVTAFWGRGLDNGVLSA